MLRVSAGVAGQQYFMVADDDAGDRLTKMLFIHNNDFLCFPKF